MGSQKGRKLSEEHRRKLSEAKKGRKLSEETKRKMTLAHTGEKHWAFGKKFSKEHRRKLSIAHKRLPLTKAQRKNTFKKGQKPWNKGKKGVMPKPWNKGKKVPAITGSKHYLHGKHLPEETKRKKSVVMKKKYRMGYVHPMQGAKQSEESKQKISVSTKKLFASGYVHPQQGTKHSEKTRRKLRQAWKTGHLGHIPWNKGKLMSEEFRRKLIRVFNTPEYRAKLRERRTHIKVPSKDTKPEKILQAFCNSEKIKFQKHKWFNLGFQRAEVDLFIEPNICILADGDRYHANPNLKKLDGTMMYPPDRVLYPAYKRKPEVTVIDKWMTDDMITKGLKKQGNVVLRFWEYDILKNPEIFQQKILKAIKKSKPTAL